MPVTSLCFSQSNEYLAAGLGDGYMKIWEIKKKEARSFKPTNIYPR
jgi:WD40 repeat protein